MKRKFTITAVATIEIPDIELPDDVSDSGEAIDAIKDALEPRNPRHRYRRLW